MLTDRLMGAALILMIVGSTTLFGALIAIPGSELADMMRSLRPGG